MPRPGTRGGCLAASWSQATTASTRGSLDATSDTAEAPSELPASPSRVVSSMPCSGLKPALRPSATRRACLAPWFTAGLVVALRGLNGAAGVEVMKSSASTVPSVKAPTDCGVAFSFSVGAAPGLSDRPWVCGSQVSTTKPARASAAAWSQYSCSGAWTDPFVITTPGRRAGPPATAHTCPEIVAPLRAVHSTGLRMLPGCLSQSYRRTSPAQPSWWVKHRFRNGLRSVSAAIAACVAGSSRPFWRSWAWYSGVPVRCW